MRAKDSERPLRAVLYARTSTKGDRQDCRSQLTALRPFVRSRGWQEIAVERDRVTGDPTRRRGDPPGLRAALRRLETREADVLVVFSCERLVRSPTHLIGLVSRVQAMGGAVVSMQDAADLDTTTDHGELYLFLTGWFARLQLKLTRARVLAGLQRARDRGVRLGRKPVHVDTSGLLEARRKVPSWRLLAQRYGVSAATIRRRWVAAAKARE